jgi:diadenylate cyclase
MPHLLHTIFSTFSRFNVSSAVDIVIVGLIFYGLLMLVRGTRADQILRGLIVVFIVLAVATSIFHLTMVDWLLRNSPLVLLVALPIIFQPELRRALEQVGRSSAIVNHPLSVSCLWRHLWEQRPWTSWSKRRPRLPTAGTVP